MKKFSSSLLWIASLSLAATQAHALHDLYGFYVSPSAGYANIGLQGIEIDRNTQGATLQLAKDNERRGGVAYALAVGYGLQNFPLRTEIEYGSQDSITYSQNSLLRNDFNPQSFNSKVESYHIMGNAIFDFHLTPKVMPYFKVGAGIARNTSKMNDTFYDYTGAYNFNQVYESRSSRRYSFAWQTGVGAAFKLTNDIYAKTELTHIDLGKVNYNSFYEGAYTMSSQDFRSDQATVGLIWYFDQGNRYTAPSMS